MIRTVYQHLKIVAASNGISVSEVSRVLDMVVVVIRKNLSEEVVIRKDSSSATALLGNHLNI